MRRQAAWNAANERDISNQFPLFLEYALEKLLRVMTDVIIYAANMNVEFFRVLF
jgi:hypothetical protein